MIYKTRSPKPGYVRITFELPSCIWADRIFLIGDFNQWRVGATPMHQDSDGVWRATVDLPYGCRCEFRYLIDGQWKTDFHADGFVTNAYGTDNSVVEATLPGRSGEVWESTPPAQPRTAPQPPPAPRRDRLTRARRTPVCAG